jgi:hypothetical protein
MIQAPNPKDGAHCSPKRSPNSHSLHPPLHLHRALAAVPLYGRKPTTPDQSKSDDTERRKPVGAGTAFGALGDASGGKPSAFTVLGGAIHPWVQSEREMSCESQRTASADVDFLST